MGGAYEKRPRRRQQRMAVGRDSRASLRHLYIERRRQHDTMPDVVQVTRKTSRFSITTHHHHHHHYEISVLRTWLVPASWGHEQSLSKMPFCATSALQLRASRSLPLLIRRMPLSHSPRFRGTSCWRTPLALTGHVNDFGGGRRGAAPYHSPRASLHSTTSYFYYSVHA